MKIAAATLGFTAVGLATLISNVASARENEDGQLAYGGAPDGELTEDARDTSDVDRSPSRPLPHSFGVHLGVRLINVKNAGYDPYSESDALALSSIGLSYSPWRTLPFSVYVVGEWNAGNSNAYARGDATKLLVHRLGLGLEGRWAPMSRFYLFTKVVPSALYIGGEIRDQALDVTLESSTWTWGLDTSAGAALRLGSAGSASKPAATFWLMMDWGYAFAGEAPMVYRPTTSEDDSRKFGDITLPSIRTGGFVTRIGAALTF